MVSFNIEAERENMGNQNVLIVDAFNLTLSTEGLPNPSIYSIASQQKRPPVVPCGGYTNKKKLMLQNLETNAAAGARPNNCWVESIRASSPTHMKSITPSLLEEKRAWIIRHPSALDMFHEITEASKGKQIVMFLDYDGTLSPIVENPDRAFMSGKMRRAVRQLAKYFPTAIVTGRCRDKVYDFVKLAELYYAGSHGMDIKGPTKGLKYNQKSKVVNFQPASEFLPLIDKVYKVLVEKTKSTPGARVENNKFCISVHFRCVDEKKWNDLAQKVKEVVNEYPQLNWRQGRMVMEIRPKIEWDKGKALEFLLECLGFADCSNVFPVYIGDDTTDEDAFKILRKREQGFGILVSKFPKKTSASYSLREPDEVMDFLQKLVRWKRDSADTTKSKV
ncbi:putative trehalose-phosphate phosphatase J [Citrus sinensis]|uniref:probable trehalose-phosphate phosphatase J isoform X2 n=1 Tax=Citrus sinensis TaxID=2711 RepID=UPI0003D78E94|nr:probable trehalose-phosphate phosphatase J isoform X2 [Citrus sinensis]KAH9670002.1 putative trehalose-phosphate phosphatase J [Citrus sinensis]